MVDDFDIPGTTPLWGNEDELSSFGLTHKKKNKEIVLIPQPSSDLNDPLNWSALRKNLHFSILFIFAMFNGGATSWTSPLLPIFTKEFGITYFDATKAGGLQLLFIALGCIFCQPFANKFGRRPVYLITTLISLISVLAFIRKSYGAFLAHSILSGLGAAPMDSLIEVSVGDIYFLDQHGLFIGLYSFSLSVGSTMGPFIEGYIALDLSTWQWGVYIWIILFGALLICEFFFLEETYYNRQSESSEKRLLELTVSKSPVQEGTPLRTNVDFESHEKENGVFIDYTALPKPYIERLKPFIITGNTSNIYELFIEPLRTFRYPAVVWSGICYGLCVCWLSLFSYTLSEFYSAPPYLFSSLALGNLNLAGLVGSVVAVILMPFSDIVQVYLSKRNNGISEPEFRLSIYWIPTTLNTLGLFLWGFSPYYKLPWISGAVGMALILLGILQTTSLGLTYVMESYPKQVPQTMAAILFLRNILGMVFNFVFQYWYDGMGVLHQTIMLAVFCFFFNMLFLVFTVYGKNIRRFTKDWYLSSVT